MKKSELAAFIKEEIKSTLNTEGVWSKGDDTAIRDFILDVKQLKDDYYEIVGSDDVFNGLDSAIRAANELIAMNEATIETSPEDLAKVKQTADKDDVIKVTEEAGIEEANIGLADIEEMGYEAGERAFEEIKGKFQNQPDHQAYRKGFFQGYIDQAGAYGLNEASYSNQYVDKNRIASNKYKQANTYKKSYDSLGQAAAEKQFDDDAIDKKASKLAKKETSLAKAKEELAQLTKQMKSLARKYKEAEGEEKEKLVADLKKKTKLKKELEAIIDK